MRVEVRHGPARPITYDVTGEEFLIGSVPGCDLRLPGTNIPPNVCLIRRSPGEVWLRKLAPSLPILVNGSPMPPSGQTSLKHGDVVSVGAVDLGISIDYGTQSQTPAVIEFPFAEPESVAVPKDDRVEQKRLLEEQAKELEERSQELEADRVLWYERRQEIERELQTAREEIARERNKPEPVREPEIVVRDRLEKELNDQYRNRREELERLQLALRETALQLRERKQQFEEEQKNIDPRLKALVEKEAEVARQRLLLDTQHGELQRQRDAFEADRRLIEMRFKQREEDLARREVDIAGRELQTRQLHDLGEQAKSQYTSDLIRLDRLSAALEAKEQSQTQRAAELDRRHAALEKDITDFEEQLELFDEREERVKNEEERVARLREEQDQREAKLNERVATFENQSITLAALRTRLEYLKDDLLRQEMRVADDRAKIEQESREAQERLRQAETVREVVEQERDGHAESFRLYQERSSLMQQAVDRLRGMQEHLGSEDKRLSELQVRLQAQATEQAEQVSEVHARAEQLLEAQQRVEFDRVALREREAALKQAEDSRDALQEQLRLRAEELATRQRELDDRTRLIEEQAQQIADQLRELETLRQDTTNVRRLTDEEALDIARRDEQLRQAEITIRAQREQLAIQQREFEQHRERSQADIDRAAAEIIELKAALSARTDDLLRQMPDLEARAQSAMDRTAQARDAMRSQLAELHAYAQRSQGDLDTVRTALQQEVTRLREQEQTLQKARAEHRLTTATFRQQLVEWQGRFANIRQSLHHGETRLDRREKEVEATEQQLAKQAETLALVEREVTEKRVEVDKHLGDMRDWYKQKFREVAETRWSKYRSENPGVGESGILKMPTREQETVPVAPAAAGVSSPILTMPPDLDPADRKLGELLRTLDIIDRESLQVLWEDAKRQRRTLRHVLLSGGYLTLYQLALIESGNLNALMLGRFRVIDRLLSTQREAVYRVFDPQQNFGGSSPGLGESGTCLLRHLGESEMLDAVRPDEYRQRFGTARDLAHPNVAATLEVLELNNRPAVLQEWVIGLPGSEWSSAVSSPGVWHRLMIQIVQGLYAAHEVGLTHGRITEESFSLSRSGIVKVIGIGEPPWVHSPSATEGTIEGDLRALGVVAANWARAATRRKGAKVKPFPNELQDILRGLGSPLEQSDIPTAMYLSAAVLLEDLDRAAATVPADTQAWDKLLAFVDENAADAGQLRRTA